MMSQRQTRVQQKLLEFITDFIREHGYGPSYREIMTGLDYKSVSTVAVHVDGLVAKGYLRKQGRSARSLEVAARTVEEVSQGDEHKTWLKGIAKERAKTNPEGVKQALKTLGLEDIYEEES